MNCVNLSDSSNTKTVLVIHNRFPKAEKKATNNELLIKRIAPIFKQPSQQTKFFLYGDTFVSLDINHDIRFEESLAIQNTFRPVINLTKENASNYLRINLDSSATGATEFNFLISILQSMQNSVMYHFSEVLSLYQSKINEEIQLRQTNNERELRERMEYYRRIYVPEILKKEAQSNPFGIQTYQVYENLKDQFDWRLSEYGVNDNLLNLIGTNSDIMQEFVLRVGWFEPTWLQDSPLFSSYFLEQYLQSLNNGFDCFQAFNFRIITLDQIIVPARFVPKCYYFMKDPNVGYTLVQPKTYEDVIGIICFYDLEIEVKHVKNLLHLRKSKDTLNKNHLLFQLSDLSLSQFQYEIQTDYFYKKYYQTSQENEVKKEPTLQELYPQMTCNYRFI